MLNADLTWLLASCLCAGSLGVQGAETGFLDRNLVLQGQTYSYKVYVPTDYSAARDWPVILYLHGAGERGQDGLRQTMAGLGLAVRRSPQRYPAIIVFPQARPESQWVGVQSDMALAALTRTMAEFWVDADRVYLTGLSMGGHGSWYLAYRYPERFAAVAPICGWLKDLPSHKFSVPVVPEGDGPTLPALAQRLVSTPIWIFHGDLDPVVPVRCSREPAEALQEVSAAVRYTEFPGLGHNSWDAAYASEAFCQWLFAQRRPRPGVIQLPNPPQIPQP